MFSKVPHIKKVRGEDAWVCFSDGISLCGLGPTPKDAYYNWADWRLRRLKIEQEQREVIEAYRFQSNERVRKCEPVEPRCPNWVWVVLAMVIGVFAGVALALDHGWRG